MAMGRKRDTLAATGLPRYMYLRRRSYYFRPPMPPRKWISLGGDLPSALGRYAELMLACKETSAEPVRPRTFLDVALIYATRELPRKAPETQRVNKLEIANLIAVFGEMPIDQIVPVDIRNYLDKRGESAEVRANREIAVMSHIFNRAREWGYLDSTNPCAGVRKFKETGREIYVSDADYKRVWDQACWPTQDLMDTIYLLGQRPQDVYALTIDDVSTTEIPMKQRKTGHRLRIEIAGEVAVLIRRLLARFRKLSVSALLVNERGEAFTPGMLKKRFNKARTAAGVSFQLRDLRAKNATDTDDLALAQRRLAHTSRSTTERYVRRRQGDKVSSLNRKIIA